MDFIAPLLLALMFLTGLCWLGAQYYAKRSASESTPLLRDRGMKPVCGAAAIMFGVWILIVTTFYYLDTATFRAISFVLMFMCMAGLVVVDGDWLIQLSSEFACWVALIIIKHYTYFLWT